MPNLRTIFITHRHGDHAPAAVPLKRATGARIVAARGVLNETDEIVSDGDMADYLASLRKLRARNPRRIFPAHGPTRDDAVALIDEYIAHRLQREQQVIDAIRNGAQTIGAMRIAISPDLDPRLERGA